MIHRTTLLTLLMLAGCAAAPEVLSTTPEAVDATHLPTPFSAEQIRRCNPAGSRVVFRMENPDGSTSSQVIRFVECDARSATIETSIADPRGPAGAPERSTSTWASLRDHASFEAVSATRARAQCEAPVGTSTGWLYTVVDESGRTSRFYFADNRPGPPVRYEIQSDGRTVFSMVMVEDNR